jgi:hypothetical protein
MRAGVVQTLTKGSDRQTRVEKLGQQLYSPSTAGYRERKRERRKGEREKERERETEKGTETYIQSDRKSVERNKRSV